VLLRDRLRRFADPRFEHFEGTPIGEDDARWSWANAFVSYVQPITPPVVVTGVARAFHDTLALGVAFVAMPPSSDFAAAWRAAMIAIAPSVPAGWDVVMLAAREVTLRSTLAALFRVPSLNPRDRLGAIAGAFHAATVMMKSAAPTPVIYA